MPKVSGFSLMEVLVSLLLLSWLLLGLAVVEVDSIKQARTINIFNLSINQLENMTERIVAGQHAELQQNINQWNSENEILLPNGIGHVEGEFPNYLLTIEWGKRMNNCNKNQLGESGCITEKVQLE